MRGPAVFKFLRRKPKPSAEDLAAAARRRCSVRSSVNGHDIKPYHVDGWVVFRIGEIDHPSLAEAEAAAAAMAPGPHPPLPPFSFR